MRGKGKEGQLHGQLKLDTHAHMACQLAVSCHCGLIAPGRISGIVFGFYQAEQLGEGEKHHFIKHKTRSCVFCVASSQQQPTPFRKNII